MLPEGRFWAHRQSSSLRGLLFIMSDNHIQHYSSAEELSPATGSRQRRRKLVGSNQTNVLPRLLIASEVAEAVHKSEKTIYKWAKQGRIPSVINIDGSILFDPEGTRKWIDDHRMAA